MPNQEHRDAVAQQDDQPGPSLTELTRTRLGRELQALYEPVIDESLDPRLAEMMRQLEADRGP